MSQLKAKILTHIASTDLSGRYRTALKVSEQNPEYKKLYFHSLEHIKSVLNLFDILRRLSGKGFNKQLIKAGHLAAAFHDAGHSGHPDPHISEDGRGNVARAVYQFTRWALEQRLDSELMNNVTLLIWSTEYPAREGSPAETMSPELREISDMLRDADMLWGTMPGNAEACMFGLFAERREAGLEVPTLEDGVKPDIKTILVNQIKFVQSYVPRSNAGRSYKNAMFDQASESWATAALEFERQMIWSDEVNKMPSDEVLRLAGALQAARRPGHHYP